MRARAADAPGVGAHGLDRAREGRGAHRQGDRPGNLIQGSIKITAQLNETYYTAQLKLLHNWIILVIVKQHLVQTDQIDGPIRVCVRAADAPRVGAHGLDRAREGRGAHRQGDRPGNLPLMKGYGGLPCLFDLVRATCGCNRTADNR